MRNFFWDISMYLRLLGIQLRSQMSYRLSFWGDLLSTGIGNGIYFISVALVLQRFGGIADWSIGEIAFLFGLMEASFGTMDMVFSGFDDMRFAEMIRLGRFDQVMLRPVSLFWQMLGSAFLLRRLGRITEGLLILAYALVVLDIHWTPAKLLYLPVVFASQVIAMGALFIVGATITFWTIQSVEAINILTYGGGEMMSYPVTIYPSLLRKFFTYVVPFVFLNYYPALFFLDKADPWGLPAFAPFLAPPVAVGIFAAALWFWRQGVNHYQSAGS